MNLKKRILATLIAATMAASAFAGCGAPAAAESKEAQATPAPGMDDPENADGAVQLNKPGELPLVIGDPVTVSAFTPIHVDKFSKFDASENTATAWYEEQTNTHFEWTIVTQAEKLAKLNLIFEGGEYEDIIFMTDWDGATQLSYAQQGYLVDIKPYQDSNDAYWWNKFKELGLEVGSFTQRNIDEFTMPDGGVYAFGQITAAMHSRYAARMYVYQPWLDTLGEEMPETTDEFYNLLVKMKNDDPNGNGIADEVPLTGSYAKGWNMDPTIWLMNSFLYYDKNTKMYADDGQLQYAPQQEAYKDGLEFFRKLYTEGLIDPAYIEQDNTAVKNTTSGDDIKVGFAAGGLVSSFMTAVETEDVNYLTKYLSVPPIEGPDGVRYAGYFQPKLNVRAHITNNCETPRTAFRMIDYMYEEECGSNLKAGLGGTADIPEEEKAWVYCAEDTTQIAINGEKPIYYNQGLSTPNIGWGEIGPGSEQPGWHSNQSIGDDIPEENGEYVLYGDAMKYEPYTPDESLLLPGLIFEGDDAATVVRLKTELNAVVDQWYALIVTTGAGAEDFDAAWDAFQTDLVNTGIEEYMELNQKAYDSRMETLNK